MTGEIICVGTELLLGDIVNTNAQFLSKELACLGINVFHQTTVGDNEARLKSAISEAVSRSDIIFLTGGLGPTKDDLTKETVASLFGLPLIEDAESLDRIEAYFKRTGRVMSENNRKQALVPEDATVFPNNHGTAPGMGISSNNQTIILLPGPPNELQPMFEESVKPFLAKFCNTTIVSHSVRLFGISESVAAELLSDLFDSSNPTVAPYAKTGEVEIRVTASAKNEEAANEIIRPVMNKIMVIVGSFVYGVDIESLQHKLVQELKTSSKKIATAESCTAGLLSKKLTEVSGSSSVFEMGIVAYANSVKINALGVPPEIIEQYGAVSPQTAAGMAVGVRDISGANIGVSITGNAGPVGSENKPVGLVYIALCDGEQVWVEELMLGRGNGNDREKIREISAKSVLSLGCRYFKNAYRLEKGVALADIYRENAFAFLSPSKDLLHKNSGVEKNPEPFLYVPIVKQETVLPTRLNLNNEREDSTDLPENFEQDREENVSVEAAQPENTAEEELSGNAAEKKKPWYRRLREYLFPCKGDRPLDIVRKIVFLVAVVVLIGSGIYVANYFVNGINQRNLINEIRNDFDPENQDINEDGIYKKFETLLQMNPDTIGWLSIKNMNTAEQDTNIDNPVFQNISIGSTLQERNDYYIHYNMFREKNPYGALFLDAAATFSQNRVSQNQVIYGHNMNDGSMFNNLRKYRDTDFLKEHMIITYDTLYRTGEYKVFAVMVTNTVASDDNNYVFNYRIPDFSSQSQFLRWIDNVRARSIFITPVDIQENDEILTLSTCIYDFDNARLVVLARRVRAGESNSVDVSQISVNPAPLYPQAWYDKKGGSKPLSGFNLPEFNTAEEIPGSSTPAVETSKITESSNTTNTASVRSSSTANATASTRSSTTTSRSSTSTKPSTTTTSPVTSAPSALTSAQEPDITSQQPVVTSEPEVTTTSVEQTAEEGIVPENVIEP